MLLSLGPAQSHAATLTWTGSAGDDNIQTAGNWSPAQAPAAGDTLVFSGTTGLLPSLSPAGLSVAGISFSASSSAFTLAGPGTYTINTGGITNSSTALQTIGNSIALAATQSWSATSGSLLFDGAQIALGSSTLTLATGANAISISDSIIGAGSIIKTGAGTLTLTGSSSFGGGFTLSAGTLIIGNAAALGGGKFATGGSMDVTNGSQTLANPITLAANTTFLGSGGNLTLTGSTALTGSRTLTVSAGILTLANTVSNSGGAYTLTKSGAGTLVLDGTNTFSNFTLSAGTVIAANGNALGTATLSLGTGTLQSSGTGTIFSNAVTLAGSPTFSGSNTIAFSGSASMTANRTVTVDNPSVTFAGPISQSGATPYTLTAAGTGALILSGTNTFANFALSSGTVVAGNSSALGTTGISLNGGTLQAGGGPISFSNTVTLAGSPAFSGSNSITFTGSSSLTGNRTLTVNNPSVTFDGVISQPGATAEALTLAGTGTLILTGTAANTYTGATTVDGGTLILDELAGVNAIGGNLTVGNTSGAALAQLGASYQNPATAALTIQPGGTLDLQSYNDTIGTLAMTGGSIIGSGTLNLGGAVTTSATGANTLSISPSLTLNGSRTFTVNNNAVATDIDLTVSGGIFDGTASSTLTKAGAGTLALNGSDSYSGGTILSAGGLALGNNYAIGSGTLSLGTATIESSGGNLTLSNPVTLAGNTTFAGTSALVFTGSASLTGSRTFTINNSVTFGGGIGQSASGYGITQGGTGTLILNGFGSNAITGTVTVNSGSLLLGQSGGIAIGGNLVIGSDPNPMPALAQWLGSGQMAQTGSVTVDTDGVMDLNGNNQTIAGLTLESGASVTTETGTLTLTGGVTFSGTGTATASIAGALNLNGGTCTFSIANPPLSEDIGVSAVLSNGALTKTGAGLMELDATNGYAGATTISAGVLQLGTNNAIGSSSAITVSSGATFDLNNFNETSPSVAGAGAVTLGSGTLTEGGGNATWTYSGAMSSSGGLVKNGTGTLTFSGSNSYTGPTMVNAGTLLWTGLNGAAPGSDATIAAGATLNSDAASETIGSVSGSGSLVLTTGTLTEGGDNASTLFFGPVTGSGGLIKTGTGILTLSASNGFTGNLSINAGTVSIGNGNELGSGSAKLLFGGGTLQATASITVSRGVLMPSAGSIDTGSNTVIVSGSISGVGALTKLGSGMLELTASNTYGGGTDLDAGILTAETLGTTPLGTGPVMFQGGSLASGNDSMTIGNSMTFTDNVSQITGSNSLTLTGFAGGSGTATINLTNGSKKVVLDPGGLNYFAPAGITIDKGTLLIGESQAIGSTTSLTLDGGTFSFEGLTGATQTMGALTLGANSTIDLSNTAGGGNTLDFSSLGLDGFTLTIDDWTGSVYGASSTTDDGSASQDRLLFAGGTAGNDLSQILFYNDSGAYIGSGYEVSYGDSLEIVPIPEPSAIFQLPTVLALIALRMGVSALSRRRSSRLGG